MNNQLEPLDYFAFNFLSKWLQHHPPSKIGDINLSFGQRGHWIQINSFPIRVKCIENFGFCIKGLPRRRGNATLNSLMKSLDLFVLERILLSHNSNWTKVFDKTTNLNWFR